MGVSAKFPVGGGDVVVHSRPTAPHGLSPAMRPQRSDHIKYSIGITYPTPRMEAPAEESTFSAWNSGG